MANVQRFHYKNLITCVMITCVCNQVCNKNQTSQTKPDQTPPFRMTNDSAAEQDYHNILTLEWFTRVFVALAHREKKCKHSWVWRSLISSPPVLSTLHSQLSLLCSSLPFRGTYQNNLGKSNQVFSPIFTWNLFTQLQGIVINHNGIQVLPNYRY